jgi:TPR repeat protein
MHAAGLVTGNPDFPQALSWFVSSTLKKHKRQSASGLYGLGYLHLAGLGVPEADPQEVGTAFPRQAHPMHAPGFRV